MIKGILFTLGFVLLALFAGLTILFGWKYGKSTVEKKKTTVTDRWGDTKEKVTEVKTEGNTKLLKKFGAFLIASVAMLGFVITVPGSFHQVEAGTYAVVKKVGKIVDVRTPGTYFDFHMTKKYEIYDATVQQVRINTEAYSKDGQIMNLEVYLQYQIQLDKLVVRDEKGNIIQTEGIAGKYVTLSSLQDRIETQCIEKTKSVMSSAEAMTIVQNRAQYSKDVSATVRNAIGPDYYVNVNDVVLTNIDFTQQFEKSVEDKVVAEQQKQTAVTKAEAEKATAIIKAEQELAVAEKQVERKIVEANAEAEAKVIIAEGEAKAQASRIVELARSLGFPIKTKYVYTENGIKKESEFILEETKTLKFVATQYVITCGSDDHTLNDLNSIVVKYLEYLAYLEQWSGNLPEVVAGEDSLNILIPTINDDLGVNEIVL